MWINQNFLLPSDVNAENGALDLKFLSLRTETPLGLKMTANGEVSTSFLNLLDFISVHELSFG